VLTGLELTGKRDQLIAVMIARLACLFENLVARAVRAPGGSAAVHMPKHFLHRTGVRIDERDVVPRVLIERLALVTRLVDPMLRIPYCETWHLVVLLFAFGVNIRDAIPELDNGVTGLRLRILGLFFEITLERAQGPSFGSS
jgi:hypothetical protein